ncbi:translocation protein SEC62 isoform X2 [Nematostella vectensis]|uniref:translocation protein SEC62 isoform X2 n=1 Tax=Nematostella vectensis TaxID=45351 RepID=UPI0020776EF1|nr:translocation protein SEC62 isoform X2 [Nematostella vectensis]
MTEVKRRRKKKESWETDGEENEPTKEETVVAKHLRWNCPTKSSTMMGNKVEYFMGCKAVDCLLDSNWASGKGKTDIIFTTRESCALYLDRLLTKGLFSRVLRIKKKKVDKDKEKAKEKSDGEGKKKKEKKEKSEKTEDTKKDDAQDVVEETKKDSESKTEEGKKKRKVKVKLELHEEQIFFDADDEAYVWIYDPVHPKTFAMGIVVVIATIAICMFPLWPTNVREYVWYISVIAAAGIGMILVLAVLRYIIFGILWLISGGRHKFWLLPNLTEECGFLESFVPLYTYEYVAKETSQGETKGGGEGEPGGTGEDQTNTKGDESSEEKESERDSWVKVTDEDVENAKSEMKEDTVKLQDKAAAIDNGPKTDSE